MTGNLVGLVQHLHTISNGSGPHAVSEGMPAGYHEALTAYWAGNQSGAIDRVSRLLAEDPDGDHRFSSYRLWVECLAERKEKVALRAMVEHLFMRGQAEPADHETYAALRGLVHLELDEFGAASLLARSMLDYTHNPQCLELVQIVNHRLEDRRATTPALCTATVPVGDYFHWQSMARGLVGNPDEEALNEVLSFIKGHYRGSPMPQVFEYHRCIDKGYYAAAATMAERLTELFPNSIDFRYYQAYAQFEDGDYPGARRVLNETLRIAGDTDPEIVGLLGHCNAKLGDAEKAAVYLRRAVSLLEAEGLPTTHVSLELANVEEEMRGDQLDPAIELPRQTRNWLIPLSARRCNELLASSENSVNRLLRPMGKEPKKGDICFFATSSGKDKKGLEQWKIVAVYAVDSDPMHHPTSRFHTALKLITRLPVGMNVPMQPFNPENAEAHDVGEDDPIRYGVYETDMSLIDRLEDLRRLSVDEQIERRQGTGQSRRPTA